MVSKKRFFKKVTLRLSFLKEVSKPGLSEADDLNQIEVSNVPEAVTEEDLQTYFEGTKSGGCANAVAECKKIGPEVFHVTFHDPKGMPQPALSLIFSSICSSAIASDVCSCC